LVHIPAARRTHIFLTLSTKLAVMVFTTCAFTGATVSLLNERDVKELPRSNSYDSRVNPISPHTPSYDRGAARFLVSPAPTAPQTTTTTITDTTTAIPTTDSNDGSSPWDEIERNYYASIHAVRTQRDAEAKADYRAALAGLQAEREAKDAKAEADYRAALAGVQAEREAKREKLRVERETEDAEKKRWFEKYRRGGLGCRGGEEEKQEEVNAQPVVNRREETRIEVMLDKAQPIQKEAEEQAKVADDDVEMRHAEKVRDADPLANGHQESPAEQARKPPPPPSTPSAGPSFQVATTGLLPEITKKNLCLRDDGVVFTDPPLMQGVPLAKISRDSSYWEAGWMPMEALVEPLRCKYNHLEPSALTKRRAKRWRTILRFLEEGELHPYQLVGKRWINSRLTNYETLFQLAQLLLGQLPRMALDVTPLQWLRQRLHEVYLEKGDEFDVANWINKAYHDPKLEQLREKSGLKRRGWPPAYATASRKRKGPHETPEPKPSKSKAGGAGVNSRLSPAAGAGGATSAEVDSSQRRKKVKIIIRQSSGGNGASKNPKIILNSPFPASATRATAAAATSDSPASPSATFSTLDSALEYDGYTSSDSISGDQLHENEWRLLQVRTRAFATNPNVTQYWHQKNKAIEHQVLGSVWPIKWSVLKKPYNFHLKLGDIEEVLFAQGTMRVIVKHKKGKAGKDIRAGGDVMAQFKRERTKRRFLMVLRKEGINVVGTTG
jgi:hypothetical protein